MHVWLVIKQQHWLVQNSLLDMASLLKHQHRHNTGTLPCCHLLEPPQHTASLRYFSNLFQPKPRSARFGHVPHNHVLSDQKAACIGEKIHIWRLSLASKAYLEAAGRQGRQFGGAVTHLQVLLLVMQLRALSLQHCLQLLEIGLTLHQLSLSGIQALLLLSYSLGTLLRCLHYSCAQYIWRNSCAENVFVTCITQLGLVCIGS